MICVRRHFCLKFSISYLDLQSQLQTLRKYGLGVHEYISKVRTIFNHLATIGESIIDRDLVMYAISNLSTNSSFNPFITLINMMTVKPSFSVFHSQLETYERILNQQSNLDKEKMFHATVAFVHKPGYTNTS